MDVKKRPKDVTPDEEEYLFLADLKLAVKEAQQGEPWEFIRLQWPNLLLSRADRQYFETDFRLDRAQVDVIKHVFARDHTEVFVKGCTGYGKGFSTALAINIWYDIWPDSRVVLVGPSHDHARDVMFAEVCSLRRMMVRPGPGNIQTDRIKSSDKHTITVANPKTGEGLSGAHSAHALYVFDEASAIADDLYVNALKQSRLLIALSNPRTLSGWFHDGYGSHEPDVTKSIPTTRGRRRIVTASGSNSVNVRFKRLAKEFAPFGGIEIKGRTFAAGEPISDDLRDAIRPLIPAQIDYARYIDIMADPDETRRLVFGEGCFPKEDASLQVVLSSWIKNHKDGYTGDYTITACGLDVADSTDGDSTILAPGGPDGMLPVHQRRKAGTMKTADWVINIAREKHSIDLTNGHIPVVVDYGGGYGRGVGDRLKQLGCMVVAVHPNQKSRFPQRYENMRAEVYGEFGIRLNPEGAWSDRIWGMPDDPALFEELTAQERDANSDRTKLKLIPKTKPYSAYKGKTVEQKIGRSPDRSDAVVLLWKGVCLTLGSGEFADRHLIHDLNPPEAKREDETPEEQRTREWSEHIGQLCLLMDGEVESAFS